MNCLPILRCNICLLSLQASASRLTYGSEADARNNRTRNNTHTIMCIIFRLTQSSRQEIRRWLGGSLNGFVPSFKYCLGCEHTFNSTPFAQPNTHYATRFVFHSFFHASLPSPVFVCGGRHTRSLRESDDCDGCKYGYRQRDCKGGYIPSFSFCSPQMTTRF